MGDKGEGKDARGLTREKERVGRRKREIGWSTERFLGSLVTL